MVALAKKIDLNVVDLEPFFASFVESNKDDAWDFLSLVNTVKDSFLNGREILDSQRDDLLAEFLGICANKLREWSQSGRVVVDNIETDLIDSDDDGGSVYFAFLFKFSKEKE
jgi:hypothetical protein